MRDVAWTQPERAAFIAAIGSAGGTFAPGLLPRSGRDQAIVTGLVTAVNYGVVAAAQTLVHETAAVVASGGRARRAELWTAAVDLAGLAGGLVAWRLGGSARAPAALRPLGLRVARTCALGFVSAAAELGPREGRWSPAGRPAALAAGAAIAAGSVHRARAGRGGASVGGAAGVGAALSLALVTAGRLERAATRRLAVAVERAVPGGYAVGLVAGRGLVLWAARTAARSYLHRAALSVQRTNARIEAAHELAPDGPTVSGGPASGVAYASLGQEGSRFVHSLVTPSQLVQADRAPGVAPVRAYVGLTSAATPEARVRLAMDELDALGGFERSVLCVAVPAGSGFVNPVAIGALEYLTGGDCASVAMQYSLRRSYQSTSRIALSVQQNRLLLEAIAERLGALPSGKRPRVLLYGESLGALTAQAGFWAPGAAALDAAGVELALFPGTPAVSSWARRWRSDADRDDAIVEIAGHADWAALPHPRRAGVRAVLLTHHDDPVPVFDRGLLVRPTPGRPHDARFRPLTTFALTAFDLKNAMNDDPGAFTTLGHDYRGDLVRAVSAAYRLPADDVTLDRIEEALRAAGAEHARRRSAPPDS